MMENRKPKILLGYSKESHENASKLCSLIGEWAQSEMWETVFGCDTKTLSMIEDKMPEYDTSIFLLSTNDIINICDDELRSCWELPFAVMLAYAYMGKNNSIVVVQRGYRPVLDLLRAIDPIVYDFPKSIEGLAYEIKKRCGTTDTSPNAFNDFFQTSRKKSEKVARMDTTRVEDLKINENESTDNKDTPISARVALAEPRVENEASTTMFSQEKITKELPTTIIDTYSFPSLKDDKFIHEYEFALIQRGEDVLITDQGKTLEYLDKIFELGEPDVIKNLVAILRQYGVKKVGNEFLIKLDSWDGNTNEDENEELRSKKYAFFSCISFMVNMKIFYV